MRIMLGDPQAKLKSGPGKRPSAIVAADPRIRGRQSSTGVIDATQPSRPPAWKLPPADLARRIDQKTLENARLRQEKASLERRHELTAYLFEEVSVVLESLQHALLNFHERSMEVEREIAKATDP
ncbi:hypothetical protein T440DRAFT_473368 [Plenodomus tracheiphilus IPT5]|uniref:Uncharacterized protein n=1 Tax=Plenodomus tracheiphilus IPT5 TaxID=1408161 RepID=A0A6A7AN27_9PLEO|nr:hypothetical protein T440DRAFT_473368 [Plenodomus tracheiphilus IPT5]